MLVPKLLFLVSALSLAGLVPAQHGEVAPIGPAAPVHDQFQVGNAMVRLAEADARPTVSRDRGRTWSPLAVPDHTLYFRIARFDPLHGGPVWHGSLGGTAANRLFVVQFRTQILAEYRRAIERRGVEVVGYLPENAYFVRADRAVVEGLRGLPMVRWVGDLAVAFKLEEELIALLGAADRSVHAGPTQYNVVLASKADRPRLMTQIAALGGEVINPNGDSVYLQAALSPGQLAQVAALDTVLWIDRTTPTGHDMDNARIQGGANYLETQTGYTGQGVRAEITEGVEHTHVDFAGRPQALHFNGLDSHGHCTAGIVLGAGVSHPGARGMLPDGFLIEAANSGWGGTSRYNVIQQSTSPALPWQAMVQTASWGNSRTLFYTSVSSEIDNALFDFDLPTTQSQSNAGDQMSRPQAWAKNIVSVGGVRHGNNASPFDDNWSFGASIGPASDGRIKPDITAYYDGILCSDRTGSSGYASTSYYTSFGGTSGATPIVCGHVGLLLQMQTDGLFGNPLPLPATAANRFANRPHMTSTKALLCNTARQYSFVGAGADLSRMKQGWGFPNVQDAYDNRDSLLLTDEYDVLSQGQSRTYLAWMPPIGGDFKVTMVYADPEAAPNAGIHRINNVDLMVRQLSSGTVYHGNHGLDVGTSSTPGGSPNDRDTVENVILESAPSDIYVVTVTAASVVRDGHVETPQLDVDFSLALHPTGGYRNDVGVALDLVSTAPGDVRSIVTGVPPFGWTDGFTFFSFNTAGPASFGGFFGLEADGLTASIFALPASAGDVFHFTPTPGQYPFVPYAFPPALVLGLSGLQVDGLVVLFGPGGVFAMSNVDRVQIM